MKIEDQFYNCLNLYKKSPYFIRNILGIGYKILPMQVKYGSKFKYFKNLLSEVEQMNYAEKKDFQLKQINKQVSIAKKFVPFYKDILSNVTLPFSTIENFKELVPFTTKEMLRENPDLFVNQSISNKEIIVRTTGGTTGEPLKFYLQKGYNRTKELVHMNDQWGRVGYEHNDLRMVFRSTLFKDDASNNRHWFDPIKNRLFVSSFHLMKDDIKLYVELLNKYKPDFLHVYPSVLNIVCNTILHNNIKIKHYPKAILCGSENTFPEQIKLFEKVFHSKVFRWYGLGEEASLAGSCEYSYDYHPFVTYSFTEIVDKKGNDVMEVGDTGEIVGTPFFNYVMPILRYKTQDFAIYGGNKCEHCNRLGPILKEVYGREQENIYDKKGQKYSLGPFIFGIHDEFWSNFGAIQFIQKKKGEVIIRSQSNNLDADEQVEYLQQQLKPKFGENFLIYFNPGSEIERTQAGKHKFLISDLT